MCTVQGCVWGPGYMGEGFMDCWQHAYASLGEFTSSYVVYGWGSDKVPEVVNRNLCPSWVLYSWLLRALISLPC